MATQTLTILVKRAWWVIPYVRCMGLLARVVNVDEDKVVGRAMKGVQVALK